LLNGIGDGIVIDTMCELFRLPPLMACNKVQQLSRSITESRRLRGWIQYCLQTNPMKAVRTQLPEVEAILLKVLWRVKTKYSA
ncbi:hypothetical protein NPIL_234921, partial [Nephila pilipes]